jgi:hypothetical protein
MPRFCKSKLGCMEDEPGFYVDMTREVEICLNLPAPAP